MHDLNGYKAAESALSLVATAPNTVEIRNARTPADIFYHSMKNGKRWTAIVEPCMVAFCPTDTAGIADDEHRFPSGSSRFRDIEKEPTIQGHETLGVLVGGSDTALNYLSNKGMSVGSLVFVDNNTGDGECVNCLRGRAGLYCSNGTLFAGIGTTTEAEGWAYRQTGRIQIPGSYVGSEGFMVMPPEKLYAVQANGGFSSLEELASNTQADALACAFTTLNAIGAKHWADDHRFDNPKVLIIGAGKIGLHHGSALLSCLPNAQVFYADINEGNLGRASKFNNVPSDRQYLVDSKESSGTAYGKEGISRGFKFFNDEVKQLFDWVIDCSMHGVVTGKTIETLCNEVIIPGGVFATTNHSGVGEGVDAFSSQYLLRGIRFVSGLSPLNNYGRSIDLIAKRRGDLAKEMRLIDGGLSSLTANLLATGGGELRTQMGATTFVTLTNPDLVNKFIKKP
ncbi:zinc-binding dehydrogenase [Candidatus Woesearchaeota archaeon]|nr:zinc-binding dehydrogenase [Candidatus Woesearchaeota archaeon]